MSGSKVHFLALNSETLEPRFVCRITNWRERDFTKVDPDHTPEPPRQAM
jgi:hypothetical protein